MLKLEADLVQLFDIPLARLDSAAIICEINEAFHHHFGDVRGSSIESLSHDFSVRKFERRLASAQSYVCRIDSRTTTATSFSIEIKSFEDGYIAFASDASPVVKVEALMESYSQMIEKQNREIKEKNETLALWGKRINEELKQAQTVQNLLVPSAITKASLISHCLPLHELSGDFHDVVEHDDGQMTFISGDVAGKGIYAAIILAQTLTAFRSCCNVESLTKLAIEIVTLLEDKVPDGLFVALTLVRQSADKKTVSVLNLGNPDAVLIGSDGIEALCPSAGPAIGVLPADFYEGITAHELPLTGKHLYVFSDGIIDMNLGEETSAFNSSDEANAYIAQCHASDGPQTLAKLMDKVGQQNQKDDVTIACFFDPQSEIV